MNTLQQNPKFAIFFQVFGLRNHADYHNRAHKSSTLKTSRHVSFHHVDQRIENVIFCRDTCSQ